MESIILIGSEEVLTASRMMQNSAERIQQAANAMLDATQQLERILDIKLIELQDLLEKTK